MTEQFDPYRKWLGIPERDQPPHHYRLLGIEPFETDEDVIANAADARMAQIKTFQTGKHSEHSQRLLNEVAAAKVCLLTPKKKAEYDRLLEKREEGKEEREERTENGLSDLVVPAKPSAYLPKKRKAKPPVWLVPSIAAGAVVLLAVVFFSMQSSEEHREPSHNDKNVAAKPRPKTAKPEPSPPAEKEPEKREPVAPAEEPAAEPEPPATAEHDAEPTLPPVVEEPVPDEEPEPEPEPPKAEPEKPRPESRPKQPGKPAVPDAAAQREAEAEIRKLYAKEFAEATDAKGKKALADKLRRQATLTRNDPTARFVLGRLSAEMSASSGDLAKGFDTLDRLAKLYEADSLRMRVELAADAVPGYRTGVKDYDDFAQLWLNADTLMRLSDEAVRDDDFNAAAQSARLAVQLARATKHAEFLRDTAAELREIEQMKARFRPVEASLVALAGNPDDGEANLAVGRWRCFVTGDWDRGLPLLAKGSDANLAELARRDIARPKKAEYQLLLAEDWQSAANNEQASLKLGVLARSCYWLEQAAPSLAGIDKARVEKQIGELHKRNIYGEKIRGVVVKGDVALEKRGATVAGPNHGERLLDGDRVTREKDSTAYSEWPCKWTVTLDRVYKLQEIRFRLYDHTQRGYRYKLSVSADGNSRTVVMDAGKGEFSGWQYIRFPSAMRVKTIVLEGLHNTENKYFAVVELEAYCIPPKAP